jgi:alginate O-acetyltransferase complex protein AlgI
VLFTEPTFLFVFLPVLLGFYFLVLFRAPLQARNVLLALASVVFYASGGGAFTWLMLASIAVNYVAALAIDRYRGTPLAWRLLTVTVAVNLASLVVFKYAGFGATNLNASLAWLGAAPLPVPAIVLPIGISFFTFHAISYVVDVYRRDAVAQKGPVEAALYLLLFPQLIAGPIVRYRDIAAQLTARTVDRDGFATGIQRFVIGLAKKMLIANIVAGPADRIFALPPGELTAAHAWVATTCYTLQIYFDFSGYSDMAIGLAHLFGFRFKENFDYPYVSRSIQEFWRRWHISLSAWFRDYLYVPLGGNRVPPRRVYVNLVTVFFLCGLWHGASWTFVVWGLWHGAFLVIERLGVGARLARAPSVLRHVYALLVVMVGWVFFRAESLASAGGVLQAMAGFGPALPTPYGVAWYLTPEVAVAMAAGVVGSTPLWPALSARMARASADGGRLGALPSALVCAALAALFAGCVMLIAAHTYNPFIYFRF